MKKSVHINVNRDSTYQALVAIKYGLGHSTFDETVRFLLYCFDEKMEREFFKEE